MANYYAKAIDILMADNYSKSDVIIEIAKSHPVVFVSAVEKTKSRINWEIAAKEFIRRDNFVEAIKHCRNITGMTLVDAKNACERLKETML